MCPIRRGSPSGPGASVYLPVIAGGQSLALLVDTGATVTLISKRVYEAMDPDQRPELRPPRKFTHIEVADQKLMAIEGVIQFQFVCDYVNFECETYVAPVGDDGLLGMDFLCRHDFTLGPA